MDKVTLEWEKTDIDRMNEFEDTDFYAFTQDSKLIYIGISYLQDIITEVKNTIRDFDINPDMITIWLGYYGQIDYNRITEQIVRDIECLLIFTNQPTYNKQCKSSYAGRDNLMVINIGCPYIKGCVKVENDYIYNEC